MSEGKRDGGKADLIIRNARIIDGTGAASRRGDLAVADDRILALGELNGLEAAREIEAGGKALAPGFIDAHTHDDRAALADPLMTCKVSQGVTTVVAGNCGVSLAPLDIDRRPPPPLDLICEDPAGFFADFAGYLDALDAEPPALNVARPGRPCHPARRRHGRPRPAADAAEIKAMRGRLEAVAGGRRDRPSTGLFYPPAAAAPTEEVIEMARACELRRPALDPHARRGRHILDSLEETFRIGREARSPVVISHHKCSGQANFGRSGETLPLIEAARAAQPVGLDAYPYVAGSTMLDSGRALTPSG